VIRPVSAARPGGAGRAPERRDAGRVGLVVDRAHGVADAQHPPAGHARVVALSLSGEVRNPAGVGDEVGAPQHVALAQEIGHGVVGELVVRRPQHHGSAQPRHRRLVEHAAEGAGREDVGLGGHGVGGREPLRPELVGQRAAVGHDIGDPQARPRPGEPHREPAPDVPQADDRHHAAARVGRAEDPLEGDPEGGLDPERRPRAGVARAAAAAGEPRDVGGVLGDDRHVPGGRTHVLGGHVAPTHRVDGLREVTQCVPPPSGGELLALPQRDDPLAPAEGEVGHRRLEGHRAREAQRVADRGAGVGVAPHPATAERRPAHGRVHGDERVKPGAWPAPDEQLFVVEGGEVRDG